MRLYEATGVGSLLLTDEGSNLAELFEPGREVVTYAGVDELVEKARHYLAHEDERRAIAAAGQARTLRDHTYELRMRELAEILRAACSDPPRSRSGIRRQARADHRRARLHRLEPRARAASSGRGRHARRLARSPSTAACSTTSPGIEDRRDVNISDVRDEHSLRYLVRDQDVLFNLAGQTSHLDSMTDPYTDLEINARSQLSILEACRHENPDDHGRLREHAPALRPPAAPAGRREPPDRARRRERDQQGRRRVVPPPLRRRLRHPDDRAAADEHLRAAHARARRPADLPRHLDPARARRRGDPRSTATAASAATSPTSTTPIAAFLLAAAREEAAGRVYNLGGDGHVSLLELAEIADRGSPAAAGSGWSRSRDDRKAIDIGDFYADYSAIESELGWGPTVGLEEGARADARVLPRARRRTTGAGRVRVPFLDLHARDGALRAELDAAIARVLDSGHYMLVRGGRALRVGVRRLPAAPRTPSASRRERTRSRSRCWPPASGAGDEVVTAPNTCIPTIVGIERAGATPVLADVDPATYTLDPAEVERRLTPRTKAILPVHLYGQPADLAALLALADAHGVVVVEDCAQAHGADVRRRAGRARSARGRVQLLPDEEPRRARRRGSGRHASRTRSPAARACFATTASASASSTSCAGSTAGSIRSRRPCSPPSSPHLRRVERRRRGSRRSTTRRSPSAELDDARDGAGPRARLPPLRRADRRPRPLPGRAGRGRHRHGGALSDAGAPPARVPRARRPRRLPRGRVALRAGREPAALGDPHRRGECRSRGGRGALSRLTTREQVAAPAARRRRRGRAAPAHAPVPGHPSRLRRRAPPTPRRGSPRCERHDEAPAARPEARNLRLLRDDDGRAAGGRFERCDGGLLPVPRCQAEDVGVPIGGEPIRPVERAGEADRTGREEGCEPAPELVELAVVAPDDREHRARGEQRLHRLDQNVQPLQPVDASEEEQQRRLRGRRRSTAGTIPAAVCRRRRAEATAAEAGRSRRGGRRTARRGRASCAVWAKSSAAPRSMGRTSAAS